MIKVSAGYTGKNVNFVIDNLQDGPQMVHPCFAALKNILMRGVPTFPSLFLAKRYGQPKMSQELEYNLRADGLNWQKTIKGGDKSNPAYIFYTELLPQIFKSYGLFLPECSVAEIIGKQEPDEDFFGWVDFYSPYLKLAIEIDGEQHQEEAQKAKDKKRDEVLTASGINIVRIKTSELEKNTEAVREKFEPFKDEDEKINKSVLNAEKLTEEDIYYLTATRLQALLVYLYGQGAIDISQEEIKLEIKTDFNIEKEKIEEIIQDYYLWLNNLAPIYGLKINIPEVLVSILTPSQNYQAEDSIKIDISLTQLYDETKEDSVYKIRQDYFYFSQISQAKENGKLQNMHGKNYFKVEYLASEFNVSKEEHEENFRFLLANFSMGQYSGFRANQLEIIIEALNNGSVIGVLPTGAGKSLCYQIVSLLVPGKTVVVSPLVMLMVDQYEHIKDQLGVTAATFINASHGENLELFASEKSIITLVSPERFFSDSFTKCITNGYNKVSVTFIVVDEAHCLSEWGHDFRTSYLCLSHNLNNLLPSSTYLMALTGTASHSVFKDIENEFYYFKNKPTKSIFAADMKRPNLKFYVEKFNSGSSQTIFNALEDNLLPTIMGKNEAKTLVFTKTKRPSSNSERAVPASACMNLAVRFQDEAEKHKRREVVNFFAGSDSMTEEQKNNVLAEFKKDGALKILFATKAFGMGIDIKDIRKTIHYGLPSSLESLYQQVGRAGRDGKESLCYIYFQEEDKENYNAVFSSDGIKINEIQKKRNSLRELATNFYFLESSNLDVEDEVELVKTVHKAIEAMNKNGQTEFSLMEIANHIKNKLQNKDITNKLLRYNYLWGEYEPAASAAIIIERALYRLFLIGEINMWSMVYSADVKNPMYIHLKTTSLSEEQKLNKLISHIERYESRAKAMPKENTFSSRLEKIISWSYNNYLIERIKSMKTLYDWCNEYVDSNSFMGHLSEYFSSEPVYVRLTEKNAPVVDWLAAIKKQPQETKLRIARLLESYENMDGLNYVSGITRLRLGEGDSFDGVRRLKMAMDGVKLLPEKDKQELFVTTYEYLETEQARDIFVDVWLTFMQEDVRKVYDFTQNKVAENYIVVDFVDKLLDVKEKLNDKLW